MKRKIFISINIDPKTRGKIFSMAEKWRGLPIKWIRENNLHVTLFFLGHIETEEVTEVCQKVSNVVAKKELFDLEFSKLELAPDAKKPQYIWLKGEESEELKSLYEEIEKALGIFSVSKKSFRPHITVGRLRKKKWEVLYDKPEILENVNVVIPVETVDVMASDFGEGDSEYSIIESCPLK